MARSTPVLTRCRDALLTQLKTRMLGTGDYWYRPTIREGIPGGLRDLQTLPAVFVDRGAVDINSDSLVAALWVYSVGFTIRGYVSSDKPRDSIEKLLQDTIRAVSADTGLGCAARAVNLEGAEIRDDEFRDGETVVSMSYFELSLRVELGEAV